MNNAVILDTETTGVKDPVIVEAAWVHVEIDNPFKLKRGIASFVCRYNPGKKIDFGAMAVHHITDEDVADCPPAIEFKLPDSVEYLIGHNIDFDWMAIGCPPVKRICTLALSRLLFPDADSHSQSAMLYLLYRRVAREMLIDAHSAATDVRNCFYLLNELVSRLNIPAWATWEDIWLISENARIPQRMPFGKYKGKLFESVPRDYKQWLLSQPDVDPYLRIALEGKTIEATL